MEERYALLRQSDFEGAEDLFQRAIEADTGHTPAYIGLSQVYHWQGGREKEALAQAEKAAELAPDSAEASAALARAQVAQLAPRAAVEAAEQAVQLDAGSAVAQAALALAYLLDRRYEAAQEAAEQAIALDPELAEGYFALGGVHQETVDIARARAALEKAVDLEPEFAPWHSSLGALWEEVRDHERAEAALQQDLELTPGGADALRDLAYVALNRRSLSVSFALLVGGIVVAVWRLTRQRIHGR